MSLNGKPLITVSVKLNLVDAKRLGILENEKVLQEGEIQNKIFNLLFSIHSSITIVDVGKAAAYITSFSCAPINSGEIEALFVAYEK